MGNNKNYYAEIEERKSRISDCTYYAFESFIIEGMPLLLDYALEELDSQIYFSFCFEDIRDFFGEKVAIVSLSEESISPYVLDDDSNSFDNYMVNINEFMSYLVQIPGIKLEESTIGDDEGTIEYSIDGKNLVDFRYEELQRMKYNDKKK